MGIFQMFYFRYGLLGAMDYFANLQGFDCDFLWVLAPLYNIIDELKIVSW